MTAADKLTAILHPKTSDLKFGIIARKIPHSSSFTFKASIWHGGRVRATVVGQSKHELVSGRAF
jgi:hypothetical protein